MADDELTPDAGANQEIEEQREPTWEETLAEADAELNPVGETEEEEATEEEAPTVDESIPEKFRGKTPAQIIEMYRALESNEGRLAQELGETRKKVDELATTRPAEQEENVDPIRAIATEIYSKKVSRELRLESARAGYPVTVEDLQPAVIMAHWEDAQEDAKEKYESRQQNSVIQQQIAPTIFNRDVSAILAANPIIGVTTDDLVASMVSYGVNPQEWERTPLAQRSEIVLNVAKGMAYDRLSRGEVTVPGYAPEVPVTEEVPLQPGKAKAPAGKRDPRLEQEIAKQGKIYAGMGLNDADLEDLAKTALEAQNG
jgi:hypothetical protein